MTPISHLPERRDTSSAAASADRPLTVFLTGASGYVGRAIAVALRARGHQVLGLVRSQASASRLPGGVTAVPGNLADPTGWIDAASAADAAIHAAYEYDATGREVMAADQTAVTALLDAGTRGRLAHVVYTSNAYLLGDHPAGVVTEDTDLPASWLASRPRLAQEARVLARRDIGAAVRVGMVHGGLGGTLPHVFAALTADGSTPFDRWTNRWSLVHLGDLAALYVRVVESRATGAFHGTDGSPTPASAVVSAAADALGITRADPRLPDAPTDGATDHLARLRQDVAVVPRRARALGWRPAFQSVVEGMPAAVADWRALDPRAGR